MSTPEKQEKIAVIGLGYVGLPLAVALAHKFADVTGFDINTRRIRQLKEGLDVTGEIEAAELKSNSLHLTDSENDLSRSTFYISSVPTPIDADRRPDLTAMKKSSETIGQNLKKGDVVVYESTVYPGVTEDVCAPILEKISGLKRGRDFGLGYSPERINPGDKKHTLATITKVISADSPQTLARLRNVYGAIVTAGLHEAPSIKVAEAAKVIENTQRDLNIALMNELSIIFEKMNIRTQDVLEAASTKWNFMRFSPGLVGGHCIGVDPFYLTSKAEQLGYHPQVILAGRRINDDMGRFVARKTIKMMTQQSMPIARARVGILGITFKENVSDIRNSLVPTIIEELRDYGVETLLHDPLADAGEVEHEYGLTLNALSDFSALDAVILAVPHRSYLQTLDFAKLLKQNGVLVDVKGALPPQTARRWPSWSL